MLLFVLAIINRIATGRGAGQGAADPAPLEDDPVALRRALWLATDRAYKAATQALCG